MTALTLHVWPALELTDKRFEQLCASNHELRLERTAAGDLVVMAPAGSDSSRRNIKLTARLETWSEMDGTGVAFESSAGFTLPNRAIRSPDAAWVRKERWEALNAEEQQRFSPLCPDFVAELRSPTDRVEVLREKLREYIENGTRLGWLIDPQARTVEIYRPSQPVEQRQEPRTLSGEDVLPGFVLDLEGILDS